MRNTRLLAPLAIDLRTLALFRVCFGIMLIADLVTRSLTLTAHYTDAGIWPIEQARQALPEFGFSLHLLNGSAGFQAGLFLLAGVLAFLFLVGYRTRLVSVLCWIMLASLNHRNHLVTQTSDTLMLCLLFWSVFLPLGARYSVDAALNRKADDRTSVCSPASAALIFQVLAVYFFGALLKTGDAWMVSGDAVYQALHFGTFASSLGVWVGENVSVETLRILTEYTWYIELWGPVLVLLPFYTARIRLFIVPGLMLLHVGFAVLLAVGIYPYLSLTSLLLLIPGQFWDWLRARITTPQRLGLTLYYDAPCGFCLKICLLLRTFLLLDSTPILRAQDTPEIHDIMQRHDSWVVQDYDGRRYVSWAAMVIVFRRSWLIGGIAGIFDTRPTRYLGEHVYRWVARHRPALSRCSELLLPYKPVKLGLPWPVHLLVTGLMLLMLYSNVVKLPQLDLDYRWPLQRMARALLLDQHWTMFAPEPGRISYWLFVEGLVLDGGTVDVVADSYTPPDIGKPASGSGYYHGFRWRKYFNAGYPAKRWPELSSYYCQKWNTAHPDTPLSHVVGYLVAEETREGIFEGDEQWEEHIVPLGHVSCSPEPGN